MHLLSFMGLLHTCCRHKNIMPVTKFRSNCRKKTLSSHAGLKRTWSLSFLPFNSFLSYFGTFIEFTKSFRRLVLIRILERDVHSEDLCNIYLLSCNMHSTFTGLPVKYCCLSSLQNQPFCIFYRDKQQLHA